MKIKSTRSVVLTLAAIVLIAATVAGTVAYLTASSEKVENTFTVGNVEITLDEAKVDDDGKAVSPEQRVEANRYHLIPGKTYDKDPTVTVKADSEDCYVRVIVTIPQYAALQTVTGNTFLPENYVEGWDPAVWPCVYADGNGKYEFRYYQKVTKADTDTELPLFTTFKVPGELTGEDLATIFGSATDAQTLCVIEAHAIQAEGFASADEAWTAFEIQKGTNP